MLLRAAQSGVRSTASIRQAGNLGGGPRRRRRPASRFELGDEQAARLRAWSTRFQGNWVVN